MRGHGLIGDIAGALVGLGRALKGQEQPGTQLDALRVGPRKTNTGRIDLFGTPAAPAAIGAAGTGTVTDEVNVEYSTRMGLWFLTQQAGTDPTSLSMEAAPDSTSFAPVALIGVYAVATIGPVNAVTVLPGFPGTLKLANTFSAPLYVTQWQMPATQVTNEINMVVLNLDVSVYSVVRFRLNSPSASTAWLGYTLSSQGG